MPEVPSETPLCWTLSFACAVTEAEKGDIGRMEGNIGIGAALLALVPLAQVARLFANGRDLAGAGCGEGACIVLA